MVISVINYGLSNLRSVCSAISSLGDEPVIINTPEAVRGASALILPGVGAFGDGMRGLRGLGLVEPILEQAAKGTPLLGICLGMQMLFDSSDEFGEHAGLGLIPGKVTHLPPTDTEGAPLMAPNINWQPLILAKPGAHRSQKALAGVSDGDEVYFIHSYHAVPEDPGDLFASIRYGGHLLCAAAGRGNVIGTQFHPEKSGETGLRILRDFLAFCR